MTEGAQTSSGALSMSVWWSLAMRRRARQTRGGGWTRVCVCVGGVWIRVGFNSSRAAGETLPWRRAGGG